MTLPEPIAVTSLVVHVLESLNVPYLIGGSLASAVYGAARTTMDVDLVAELRVEHVNPLVSALGSAFYVDVGMIQEAIRNRGSFNMIHLETMFKVDVFIHKERPFDRSQFERRISQLLSAEPEHRAYFASPEDTILAKLEWYRLGGEVSERQWRDVQVVLKAQSGRTRLPCTSVLGRRR
jgi:hypothetical protein